MMHAMRRGAGGLGQVSGFIRRTKFWTGRLALLSAALVLLGNEAMSAQQAPNAAEANTPADEAKPATVSVDVRVVNVLATVRDKHGKIVPNLTKDDFTLEEDSHPVTIGYFSRESHLPLTLGLLVDTSRSQRQVLEQERGASKTFLDQVLREKDAAFLIHFDREVELLQDLTSSRQKLESALESLHVPSAYERDDSGPGSQGSSRDDSQRQGRQRGYHRADTALYDGIYLASDELMSKQQGRKAVIILSDGVDRGSKESLEGAIEAAQRSDTVVYSVLFRGEEPLRDRGGFGGMGGGIGGPMGGGGRRRGGGGRNPQEERPADGKKTLERISKETGGRMFEVSKKEPIDQIYRTIQEELRNQYNLGFSPVKADSAGYHKLLLKTTQKDNTVQARDGFYLNP